MSGLNVQFEDTINVITPTNVCATPKRTYPGSSSICPDAPKKKIRPTAVNLNRDIFDESILIARAIQAAGAEYENSNDPCYADCDSDGDLPTYNKPVKPGKCDQMLQYFLKHNITAKRFLFRRPREEWIPFVTMPRFNEMASGFYNVVCSSMQYLPFNYTYRNFVGDAEYHEDVVADTTNDGLKLSETKIFTHLRKTVISDILFANGLNIKQVRLFAVGLVSVVSRQAGKRNTFVLQGPADANKTTLMKSFTESYFEYSWGAVDNDVRNSFKFEALANKRIAYWDEPMIVPDNIEQVKLITGGELCACNVKHQSGIMIEPIPMLITTNNDLWHHAPQAKEALQARCPCTLR